MGKTKENEKQFDLVFAKAYNLLLADTCLTPAEKLVMIIVGRYWPNPYWDSNEQIAKDLGFTERYIEKIIKKLADKKYIKRKFAHTSRNSRPHTVRVIVPMCFPEKCRAKIKWIKTEQSDGQNTEQTDGQHPNNRTQLPEQSDDLLEINRKEIKNLNRKATPPPLPAGGQASALPDDSKAEQQGIIEQFKNSFGKPKRQGKSPMTEEQKNAADKELKDIRKKLLG